MICNETEGLYKVYHLIKDGKVVYVGQTKRSLDQRLKEHTLHKPTSPGKGKFIGEKGISIQLESLHLTRKDARLRERDEKLKHGLEWTESNWTMPGATTPSRWLRALSFNDATKIRNKYDGKRGSIQKLAKEYNTSDKVIRGIVNNKTYLKP